MNESDKKWLTDHFGSQVAFNEPMSKHTTFGIGGPANVVTVKTDQQLRDLVRWAGENGQEFMILGAGSNLLVRDRGLSCLVLKLVNGFEAIEAGPDYPAKGSVTVTAGAGVLVRQLGKYALDRGLGGLNFTLGIPGTVGGALRMNAGAWGACMADTTHAVCILNSKGDVVTMGRDQLRFFYRGLDLEQGSIILRGEFRLKRTDSDTLRSEAMEMQRKRRSSQPLSLPCAGSVFRNPHGGMSAGELIDKAGLKGLQKGGAQVSTKHANFIVNKGHAKASDVLALMEQIQKSIFERFGVELEPEVIIVG